MSRATFDPKISSLGAQSEAASPASETVPGNVQTTEDIYANSPADPYKQLLGGTAKAAETSVIGEMIGEFDSAAKVEGRRRDPMQEFLDGFVFGRGPAKASDFELPSVPKFYRDIMKKLPDVKIEAVIQKYRDLRKVIKNLKIAAEKMRRDPLCALKMGTDELHALTAHIRQLDAQLIKCETELAQAKDCKAKHDARARAAAARTARGDIQNT